MLRAIGIDQKDECTTERTVKMLSGDAACIGSGSAKPRIVVEVSDIVPAIGIEVDARSLETLFKVEDSFCDGGERPRTTFRALLGEQLKKLRHMLI
ncbi:MAG: hypothetical protein AAF219_11120 [Myxococcota bacterium]